MFELNDASKIVGSRRLDPTYKSYQVYPMRYLTCLCLVILSTVPTFAADPPAKPVLKITPGKVIIPFDKMRRIWGELIAIDPKTRTGSFRNESNDEVMKFTIMPYAELLHHATRGDVQDYRPGERAIFRLHENEKGEWVYLTYIQDEMNFQRGHGEYYFVDAIDPKAGTITFTQAKADKSFVRETGLVLETDENTRYWKDGKPAKFTDIQVGDKLLTKTHGRGKGKHRVCWEVYLDDASRDAVRDEQIVVQRKRLESEGLPGYVDTADGSTLTLSLFPEGEEIAKTLKVGQTVTVAPAGVDRKPTASPIGAKVAAAKAVRGRVTEATLALDGPASGFTPTELARVWVK